MLGYESRGELHELAPELRDELRSHEILDWLLVLRLGINVDFELSRAFDLSQSLQAMIVSATYHKLVLCELVRELGHGDGARDIVIIGSGAYTTEDLAYNWHTRKAEMNNPTQRGIVMVFYSNTYLYTPILTSHRKS
jgi:hypothetical protein